MLGCLNNERKFLCYGGAFFILLVLIHNNLMKNSNVKRQQLHRCVHSIHMHTLTLVSLSNFSHMTSDGCKGHVVDSFERQEVNRQTDMNESRYSAG